MWYSFFLFLFIVFPFFCNCDEKMAKSAFQILLGDFSEKNNFCFLTRGFADNACREKAILYLRSCHLAAQDFSFPVVGFVEGSLLGGREFLYSFLRDFSLKKGKIEIIAYRFHEPSLISLMEEFLQTGGSVSLYTDKEAVVEETFQMQTRKLFSYPRFYFDSSLHSGLMHEKVMLLDRKYLVLSTANFTENDLSKNVNLVVFFQDSTLNECVKKEIQQMHLQKYGKEKSTCYLDCEGGNGTKIFFSPSEKPADEIIKRIFEARHSIRILAYSLTDERIIKALHFQAQRGVHLCVIADQTQMNTSEKSKLFLKNYLGNYMKEHPGVIHAKVIEIDGKTKDSRIIFGSYNFSRSAAKKNDEFLVSTQDFALTERISLWLDFVFDKKLVISPPVPDIFPSGLRLETGSQSVTLSVSDPERISFGWCENKKAEVVEQTPHSSRFYFKTKDCKTGDFHLRYEDAILIPFLQNREHKRTETEKMFLKRLGNFHRLPVYPCLKNVNGTWVPCVGED